MLKNVHVVVSEYHPLHMTWSRSTKQVASQKKFVDENTKTVIFKDSFNCTTSLPYNTQDGVFLRDENRITLFLGSTEIASCTFDIALFVNKARNHFKTEIKPASYVRKHEEAMVLLGDAANYPGCFIEFNFKVTESASNSTTNRDSTMHKSALGSARGSSYAGASVLDENVQA